MQGFQQLIEMPLPDLIKWWVDQKPTRNITALAKNSGIHRTSLNRYLEDGKAQYQKVKQLVCYIFSSDMQLAFKWLENNYSEQAKADYNFFQFHNRHPNQEFVDDNFQEYLRNPNTFRIVHVAGTVGITEKQIEQALGQYGLKALNELIEAGILVNRDGKFRTIVEDWSVNSYDTITAELENVTSIMKQRRDGHIFQDSLALNQEGLEKIKELQQSLLAEVAAMKDKYKGDLPVFVSTFLTKLD